VEAVQHGVNGLLVPSENVGDLRDALLQLLGNPNIRREFSRQATGTVKSRFSMDTQLKKIENLIINQQ